jgi:hypothetical protein
MKNLILGILLMSGLAHASGQEGHGGVVFVCQNHIQLVDAWEAEDMGYPLSLGKDVQAPMRELAKEYLRRLAFFEAGRAKQYSKMANEIFDDLELLEANPKSMKTKWVRFTKGVLPFSLDSDEITQPIGCTKVQAVTQKLPQLDGEKLFTIDQKIWHDMDNETRVLTIFHEINVFNAVRLGFTNTTAPARQLNRLIASPELSGSKSVCNYIISLNKIKMVGVVYPQGVGYLKAIQYGTVLIDPVSHFTCWDSTGRLKDVQQSYYSEGIQAPSIRFTNFSAQGSQKKHTTTLSFSNPSFNETDSNWNSANLDSDSSFYESELGDSHSPFSLSGGKIYQNPDGSFKLKDMKRSRARTGLGGIIFDSSVQSGSADLEFSSLTNGTVKETIH